jgi:hypothetical protein
LRRASLTAQQLRIGTSDAEREVDHLVGRLAIRKQNQEIAGLGCVLLLSAERSIPVDRLVENLNDLLAGEYGYLGVRQVARTSGACAKDDGADESE